MRNNKKAIAMGVTVFAFVTAVMLILIPIENKRKTYEKYGELAVFAETDERAEYIIKNSDEYPESVLKVYYEDTEDMADFEWVYNYPFHKDDYMTMTFTEEELNSENVPALYMYDPRWSYEKIGGAYIKVDGCGAVSITMAALYLNHNSDIDPVKVAQVAEYNDFLGTIGGILTKHIAQLLEILGFETVEHNYNCEDMTQKETIPLQDIQAVLEKDHVCLVAMYGDTFGGHAMIITEANDDGTIRINDPASEENTEKVWNYKDIEPELICYWDVSAK